MSNNINPMDDFSLDGWENFFAEDKARQPQADALDFIAKNWKEHDSFLICAPTGVGKSAIGLTLARTLASQVTHPYGDEDIQYGYSYLTTTSIELQNQYMKSYEKIGLQKMYSATNFRCNQSYPMSCKEGKQVNAQGGGTGPDKKKCPGICPYDAAKSAFIVNPFGIMNLAYFLFETHFAHQLQRRGLMIFDEAHNIGDYVKNFVTIEITDYHLQRHKIKAPRPNAAGIYQIDEFKKWLGGEYLNRLNIELAVLTNKRDGWPGSPQNAEYLKLCSEIGDLSQILEKINHLFHELNPTDWVAERLDDRISITPISPKKFMKKYLISKNCKSVFMSATLFDKNFTMTEYDLDPKRTCFFTTPSPFPIKNRPIHILPVGKLDYNNMAKSMVPFAKTVKELVEGHPNERGIIFVSSYSQANELIKQVKNPRLITHVNSKDKLTMMELHRNSTDTFIVSPSMHEGVDLVGDLSRVQIMLKLPFKSLGSYAIKRRAELYPSWYAMVTILSIVQASGRSIRNENDFCVTYILDSNWLWFFPRWKNLFPSYWTKSIIE